jgi:biopolymer transport protein ExbD|tara:strand:+ start:475 stop:888 length:414 start_codon:yes stop_codon:yes gene_type:complete
LKTHSFYEREERELISINITPLIDIVFLLLVFFMLATSFIQKSTIEVNLSSGETIQIENQKNNVILILNKKGQVYLNNKLINISNIKNEIIKIIDNKPEHKILIKSHKKIAVQKVIRLIEEVRLAGTDNIKLVNLEK